MSVWSLLVIFKWCSSESVLCVANRVKTLAAHRRARLNEAQTLHQFFRDIDDEEAWIKYVNVVNGLK